MARITNPAVLRFAARFGIYPAQPLTDGSAQAQRRSGTAALVRAAAKPLVIPERAPAPNSGHSLGPRVFTQGATHRGTGYGPGRRIIPR